MDLDVLRKNLFDLLDSGGKNGRKWFFPQNVSNQYKVIAGLTLGELIKYFLPALIITVGICFIPPISSVVLWVFKIIIIMIIVVILMVYVMYRPVQGRDNIRTKDLIKEHVHYIKKQKIYYKKPKSTSLKGD